MVIGVAVGVIVGWLWTNSKRKDADAGLLLAKQQLEQEGKMRQQAEATTAIEERDRKSAVAATGGTIGTGTCHHAVEGGAGVGGK